VGILVDMITIVIPIRTIVLRYKGGWEAFFHGPQLPPLDGFSRDEYMARTGSMNPMTAEFILTNLRANGLKPTATRGGERAWNDVCVLTSDGPTLRCDWIYFDPTRCIAHYAEKGLVFPSRVNSYESGQTSVDS